MKRVLAAAALTILAALPAHADPAEQCKLPMLASLTLKQSGGAFLVPITIKGAEHDFLLEISEPFSLISGEFADAQGLKSATYTSWLEPQAGAQKFTQQVAVPDFSIGAGHFKEFKFLRADHRYGNGNIIGEVGMDMLEPFDIELDLNAQKINLFSRNDCAQKVYWASKYAAVPFTQDEAGHIALVMSLDDTKLTVDLNSDLGASKIASNTLERVFGLTLQSPGMTSEKTDNGYTIYHYPFERLALNGIVVSHPKINIWPSDKPECRPETQVVRGRYKVCFGSSDLHLSGDALKALRMYISFKEKMIYVTAADAHT